MKSQVWHHIDKSTWPAGPWQSEPDVQAEVTSLAAQLHALR
jgi:hypothetical protein